MGLPAAILNLLIERGVPYDWTIHDYYTICPGVNLIGERGTYCGEPDQAGCNRCLARVGDDQGRPVPESIAAWRGKLRPHARRRAASSRSALSMPSAGSNVVFPRTERAIAASSGVAAQLRGLGGLLD